MKTSKKFIAALAFSLTGIGAAHAVPVTTAGQPTETIITAYQGPMSLFQERFDVSLSQGAQIINLNNMPNTILPESIMLDVSGGHKVNSYNFTPYNVTPQALLNKLVGSDIGWATTNPNTGKSQVTEGRLISVTNGIVIKFPHGIELNPPGRPAINNWPENALLGQGIRINVVAKTGPAPISIGYLAGGLNWQADYVIMLQGEETAATFQGQMSINNQTGRDFADTKMRLVAGHINMQSPRPKMRGAEMSMASAPMADGFSESSAFDSHIYELAGQHDLETGTMLSVPFIASDHLQIRKRYVLEGYVRGNPEPSGDNGQFVTPEIRFSLKNDKAAGLGKALPAGTIRVMALQDGIPMLLGEDRINHTPKGEQINLRTGSAFDVTAKRKQTGFKAGNDRNNFEASYEIILNNTKPTGVVVDLVEHLPGQWKITNENMRHVKRDAATAIWSLSVPANGSMTLKYTMKTHR